MFRSLVLFVVFFFASNAIAQEAKIETLKQLYGQGYYKMVYRRAGRLLMNPAYDNRKEPSQYRKLAIQELANQEEDIDLVVLCAHGYTGQTTWPYGSVARNYMEHGTKPVLVIQDVLRSQVQQTAAGKAAEKSGRR